MTVDGLVVGESIVSGPGVDSPRGGGAGAGAGAGGPSGTTEAAPEALSGPFLTVAEVARRMRVSKMTVYRLVHSGELPANRFGRTFRVQRGAVEELIQAARYRAG
jgi:excisionase family DNA binding protein